MARRRMNDTAALVVAVPDGHMHEHHSRSSRKIENGYVHSESHEKNGEYSHREYFSRSPQPKGERREADGVGCEGLSGAMKELSK